MVLGPLREPVEFLDADGHLGECNMPTINGSSGNDRLTGTIGADEIYGFGGNDRIDASGGDDVLSGGDGNDVLIDGSGNDSAFGGDGYDTFLAGAGNDTYVGGTDIYSDLVSYQNALAGVFVDLSVSADHARSIGTGDAAGIGVDQLLGISDLRGSRYADTLIGDAAGNAFYGGDGNDSLSGGEGVDVLEGGLGNDFINGGAGEDAASYYGSPVGVTVLLSVEGSQNTGVGRTPLST